MFKKIVVAFVLFCAFASSVQAQSISPEHLPTILETYAANQARFTVNYRGKKFSGQMMLSDVVENPIFKNHFSVQFDVNGQEVDCSDIQDKGVIKRIVNWDKGQQIIVTGTIQDVTLGDLQLSNCEFVPVKPNK
jgi:hypothetical protein